MLTITSSDFNKHKNYNELSGNIRFEALYNLLTLPYGINICLKIQRCIEKCKMKFINTIILTDNQDFVQSLQPVKCNSCANDINFRPIFEPSWRA